MQVNTIESQECHKTLKGRKCVHVCVGEKEGDFHHLVLSNYLSIPISVDV